MIKQVFVFLSVKTWLWLSRPSLFFYIKFLKQRNQKKQQSLQADSSHDLQHKPQGEYISESYHIKQTHTDSSPQYSVWKPQFSVGKLKMKVTLAVHSLQRPSVRKKQKKKTKNKKQNVTLSSLQNHIFANVTHLDRFISCAGDKEISLKIIHMKKNIYKCASGRKF